MESWRRVWRDGFAPGLSTAALRSLADGLASDDEQLRQAETVCPTPLACVLDWPPEGACAVGYAGWKGDGLLTVGDVATYFARVCREADMRLRGFDVAAFLHWFDDTPRETVRRELLAEVELALGRRTALPVAPRPLVTPAEIVIPF